MRTGPKSLGRRPRKDLSTTKSEKIKRPQIANSAVWSLELYLFLQNQSVKDRKLHKYSVNQNSFNNKFQFTEYLKSQSRDLQEAERYADVTEAVWLTVVLLEIVVGEFSAPDEVIITTERKFDLESIRLGFDLHQAAGLP